MELIVDFLNQAGALIQNVGFQGIQKSHHFTTLSRSNPQLSRDACRDLQETCPIVLFGLAYELGRKRCDCVVATKSEVKRIGRWLHSAWRTN